MIFCCTYCKDKRHPGCHATCEDYKRDREKFDKLKEKERREKTVDGYIAEKIVGYLDKRAKNNKDLSVYFKHGRDN